MKRIGRHTKDSSTNGLESLQAIVAHLKIIDLHVDVRILTSSIEMKIWMRRRCRSRSTVDLVNESRSIHVAATIDWKSWKQARLALCQRTHKSTQLVGSSRGTQLQLWITRLHSELTIVTTLVIDGW